MLLIGLAALFSVLVSVLLKSLKKNNFDIFQILAFNYISASILAWWWFKPNFQHLQLDQSWWLIVLLAVLLPSVFWCLNRSLQQTGLIQTEIAQRIAVVLTILLSSIIYQEHFSELKVVAIVLGVVAVLLMLLSPTMHKKSSTLPLSLLGVWFGYAAIDLLFKYTSNLGLKFSSTLTLIFICAALLMLLINFYRKVKWQLSSIFAGLGLGVLNFANIALYLQAHQQLKDQPAIVFASMNICVVVLGVIFARLLFKEAFTRQKVFGVLCAILAIYLLMQSML